LALAALIMADAAKIPVIDISDEANEHQVAKDLVEAAIEHGFIYIKNTGKDIPVDAVNGAFDMVFFPKSTQAR
jgi:isopenicillin N synthase-like dioxygenase